MLRLTKAAIAALGFGALAMMPATNAVAQPNVEQTEIPFFVGLKAGESALLGRSGPLLIRARCLTAPHDWYDYNTEPPSEGLYWLELWVKGRQDGWFHEEQDNCREEAPCSQQPLPAGAVEWIADETNDDNGGPFSPHYDNETSEFTAISPRGDRVHTLGFDGDSLGIGIRILGYDCLVHGVLQAKRITGVPADD